jgi:hypothetical protein
MKLSFTALCACYPPPRTRIPKQNLWISFDPQDLGSDWAYRSSAICLLLRSQFLLDEKRERIGKTTPFFSVMSGVRVLGNTSNTNCWSRPKATLCRSGPELCVVNLPYIVNVRRPGNVRALPWRVGRWHDFFNCNLIKFSMSATLFRSTVIYLRHLTLQVLHERLYDMYTYYKYAITVTWL